MSEKMLVTQALDERDLLVKKIADKIEKATIQTSEEGVMTGDLYMISKLENKKKVDSKTFLEEINTRLASLMA